MTQANLVHADEVSLESIALNSCAVNASNEQHNTVLRKQNLRAGLPANVRFRMAQYFQKIFKLVKFLYKYWLIAIASLTCAGAMFLFPFSFSRDHFVLHIQNSHPINRTVSLPDGSNVMLSGKTQIDVRISENLRRVHVKNGAAFFNVAHDSAKPFIVIAGSNSMKVFGTQFEVLKNSQGVRISVAEGHVLVSNVAITANDGRTHANLNVQHLFAGEQVLANEAGELDRKSLYRTGHLAWLDGRLEYDDESLQVIIEDANRYRSKKIELSDSQLAEMRLTMAFSTQQTDVLISSLAAAGKVEIVELSDRIILIPPRFPSEQ